MGCVSWNSLLDTKITGVMQRLRKDDIDKEDTKQME